jgi:hypothetical protein
MSDKTPERLAERLENRPFEAIDAWNNQPLHAEIERLTKERDNLAAFITSKLSRLPLAAIKAPTTTPPQNHEQ